MADNAQAAQKSVVGEGATKNSGLNDTWSEHQKETAQVTSEIVEANRRKNVTVTEEQEDELRSLMRPQLLGLLTTTEYQDFLAYRSKFFDQLLTMESLKDAQEIHQPLRELMNYSIETDCDGGMLFLNLFKHFCKDPTEKQLENAYLFAWVESVFLGIYQPLDDMIDKASLRRFKKAYYLDVGPERATMFILTVFFALIEVLAVKLKDEPFGFELLQRFAYYATVGTAGQTLDSVGHQSKDKMWDLSFRLKHNIAMLAPVVDLPLEIAAIMTGYKLTSKELDFWKSMMLNVTTFLRNINDFADAYSETPTGKQLYNDIVNGCVSWCSGSAWLLANAEQQQRLMENYGSKDTESIAKVLQVYEEVKLKEHFRTHQKKLLKTIWAQLAKCPHAMVPKQALLDIINYATKDHGLFWQ